MRHLYKKTFLDVHIVSLPLLKKTNTAVPEVALGGAHGSRSGGAHGSASTLLAQKARTDLAQEKKRQTLGGVNLTA